MKKTKKALASLAIAGMTLSMIPFNAFAAGTVPTRLAGTTAEQTAVAIADQTGYTGTAILASSASYGASDALTAGPLAAFLKAPILLQGPGSVLNADTKAELEKLNVKTVYVTSGTAVISQAVLDQIKGLGITVESLGGNDRFETSVNIAKKLVALGAPVKKVAVAYGWLNQDALSIAAIASAANEPIILTEKTGLSASAKAFLAANLGITAADVIGGTGVIDASVLAQLPSPTRHFGNTAYDTNNQVIQDFASSLTFGNVFVANGVTGIDALAGAPLAAMTKSAIVLTDGVNVPAAAAFTFSKSAATSVVTALGGAAVVPESVRTGVAAGKVSVVPGELAIVSVTALDDTNRFLQMTFSKAVTSLTPSDITIVNAKTAESYGVKAVTLAANGLSAQLELFAVDDNANILQYLTDYTITVNANGQVLKANFNRALSDEVRVLDINVADKEITVIDNKYGGAEKNLKVLDANFDYQAAIGELAQVWYNTDNELVKYQISSTSAKYDAIEITKADEIKLLSEDKKYDISTEEYDNNNNDAKFAFYLNGEKVDDITSYDLNGDDVNETLVGHKFNFAKVGFDKSGDIEYVSVYNLSQFLVVDKVDNDEVVGIEGEGTGGSFDAEDATIVKDGKVITLADLKKGDVLYFDNDADDKDGFAEVYSKTVTGAIDEVYQESISVDGNTYDFVYDAEIPAKFGLLYGSAVYVNEDGDTAIVDSDAAEELQAAGDVTLNLDRAGNLVYISGDVAEVSTNTKTAILTDNIQADKTYGKYKAQFSALLENGDEKVYDLTLEDLDTITIDGVDYDIDSTPNAADEWNPTFDADADPTQIVLTNGDGDTASFDLAAEGKLVNFKLNDNGTVKEIELFTDAGTTEGGFRTTATTVQAGDSYLDGKKLLDSTLVFDANKGYDNDNVLGDIKAGDVTVTKWSDYKGTDISNSDFIFNKDNEVIALAIRTTTTTDTSYEEAVVTNVLRNTDGDVVQITAYVNGAKKTYQVDEVTNDALVKGDAVVLEIDDNNPNLVTDLLTTGDEYTTRVLTGLSVAQPSDVNVGTREVTFTDADGNTFKYKLVSNGAVLDGTDNNDITVETLADLREKNNVTVVLDESTGTTFAKYFIFETNIVPE